MCIRDRLSDAAGSYFLRIAAFDYVMAESNTEDDNDTVDVATDLEFVLELSGKWEN